MATYPFTRGKPAGWATGEILTSTQANTMDDNAASGADGALWTDVALLLNWGSVPDSSSYGTPVYDAATGLWMIFGVSVNQPIGRRHYCNWHGTYHDAMTFAAMSNITAVASAASDGAGTIVIGCVPSGATAQKLQRSADSGDTWSAVSVNDSTANGVAGTRALQWFDNAGLFVVGLGNGVIETSPTGATWTNRTVPNAHARRSMASSSSRIVVTANSSQSVCITSPDGVTWSEATLPSAATWNVAYSANEGIFMAVGGGAVAVSNDDGLTWSAAGLTAPGANSTDVACFGRVWVVSTDDPSINATHLKVSLNNGVTWKTVLNDSTVISKLNVGGKQMVATYTSSGGVISSLRGGLLD